MKILEAMILTESPEVCPLCDCKAMLFDRLEDESKICVSCSHIQKLQPGEGFFANPQELDLSNPWILREVLRIGEFDVRPENGTIVVKIRLSALTAKKILELAAAHEISPAAELEVAASLYVSRMEEGLRIQKGETAGIVPSASKSLEEGAYQECLKEASWRDFLPE